MGYDQYGTLHLAEVDGVTMWSLRQLKGMVEQEARYFVRFWFEPHGAVLE